MRTCKGCGEDFPKTSEFFYGDGKGYLKSYCKPCHRQRVKDERSPERDRKAMLKHKFGITPEIYDQMLQEQGGKCKLCGTGDPGRKYFAVDHCHDTGKVRGLLCQHCNLMLGHAKDNIETLESAIDYLRTSRGGTLTASSGVSALLA